MAYISIEVICDKCQERYGLLVEREKRNEPQHCDKCGGGMARRVWSVPNVSTTKTSESIPSDVAKGRFDHLRTKQEMRKEVARAKAKYAKDPSSKNAEEVKRTRKENDKIK
jgi:hypothetical protein